MAFTNYRNADGLYREIEVTDRVENALTETRRAIWRNNAQERYYRKASLDAMSDHDERTSCTDASPEEIYIAAEEQAKLRTKLAAALKSLTPEQLKLVKLLKKGMGIREIARVLGKHHSTIEEMRKAVQKKFEKFLR